MEKIKVIFQVQGCDSDDGDDAEYSLDAIHEEIIDKDKIEIKVSDKPHVLEGRGFDEKSDHIAHFHPSIPKNISADLRELYLEFSKDE